MTTTLGTSALDAGPYWIAPSTGLVHLVEHVMVVWRGPSATWERPRIVVERRCGGLSPTDRSKGLSVAPGNGPRCRRCFA